MKKLFVLALAAAMAAPLAASATGALKGAQYLPQAKVSLAQARAIAIKTEHGTIVDQELEKEKGGLRYSFDVKVGKKVHEVGVDAMTGKVLEDSIDDGND